MNNKISYFSKIVLGTAQFGLDYGVTNHQGIVPPYEVKAILNFASSKGITGIDTARLYGKSEDVIGQYHQGNFQVITKFPYFPENITSGNIPTFLSEQVAHSLSSLKMKSIDSLLSHNIMDFIKHSKTLVPVLEKLKSEGKIKRFGVSAYNPDQVKEVLDLYKPDVIQVPLNVFDQTFLESKILERAKKEKIEIHIRSIFLQGIILQKSNDLDPFFDFFKSHYQEYLNFIQENKLSNIMAALKFGLDNPLIDKIIVGICSQRQLEEIALEIEKLNGSPLLDFAQWKFHDQRLINPLSWPMLRK